MIHGFMDRNQIKEVCKKYDASVNEYLTAVFTYSIYMEYLHGQPAKRPIVICIPVNLRPYFDSMTTRNFFAMVSASFLPEQENMTLDEVVRIVKESLRSQINKEHLEEIFSYNVSNPEKYLTSFGANLYQSDRHAISLYLIGPRKHINNHKFRKDRN